MNNVNERLHVFVALNFYEFYKFSGKSDFKTLTRTMHTSLLHYNYIYG